MIELTEEKKQALHKLALLANRNFANEIKQTMTKEVIHHVFFNNGYFQIVFSVGSIPMGFRVDKHWFKQCIE